MVRRSFHSVVEIPLGSNGQALPALFLQDGELSLYCLAWARDMMIVEDKSPAHLSKAVKATGLLYDFYISIYGGKPLAPNEMSGLMRQFFEARSFGNCELGWKPVGKKTAKHDVRYASEFSEFCADNFGTLSPNPVEEKLIKSLSVSEQMQHYANLKKRETWDMLYYLTPATQQGQGILKTFSFDPRSKFANQEYCHNYFPPDKVLKLIAATDNLRDRLAFIILFFGGLRESELLHLYVTDITAPGGDAKIRIGHPEQSNYSWEDPFRGKQKGTRSHFLSERYGLTPRNKLGLKNPYHAGWKGMLYTHKTLEADFYWLIPEIGRLFAQLHHRYLREFRASATDLNPYYFINFKGEHFGTALKRSNLTKSFYRAAKRIGLSPSDSGVNPHGARHFYGHFCASYLKIPMEETQLMLRHASINSTQVYYSIEDRVVREELQKGYERITQDIPNFIKEIVTLAGKG